MSQNVILAIAVLGGISEALSLIPGVKANGVFQLLANIIKAISGK